jgi:hypothetical protein
MTSVILNGCHTNGGILEFAGVAVKYKNLPGMAYALIRNHTHVF